MKTEVAAQTEQMRLAAQFAELAPSVHNTQPWRFVARPNALEIHVDPDRKLDYIDPSGRQLHLSCGAAIELARLGIRYLGLSCTVRLLPDPSHDTLVAKLVVGFAEPVTGAEQRLIDAVPRRYTDRGPYTDEPPSWLALQKMREAAGERHCWLRVLDHTDDRLAAIRLLESAEAAEATEDTYREEITSWQRSGAAHDGIPVDDLLEWERLHRVSDVPLRDFTGRASHPTPGDGEPPAVERDTIVVLGTDRDDRLSWLQAGRALADVLLTLTDANLVSQPLGPALDLPATRARLRRELGLVGYPQMMLRVGHGMRVPVTGRRPIDEVFSVAVAP
ncbi:MAG TPA: hypothetical protein VHE57_08795 [Mycobacteriales bacterium]|nr:hypothetical protein [Mycobacteriales bacterium]